MELEKTHNAMCWLSNTLLDQKIRAFKERGINLSFADQCKELTKLRNGDDEIAELFSSINSQVEQTVIKRIHKAFDAFFRRVKNGETPGFPRFKSKDRFSGWSYTQSGWKLSAGAARKKRKMTNGFLYLSGVGHIKIRGSSRTAGIPKTCDIMRKGKNNWYASIVIECDLPQRTKGSLAAGIDWGTTTFVEIAVEDGSYDKIDNPRHTRNALEKLAKEQRKLSKKTKGSKNRKKQANVVGKIHSKTANKRKDFLHKSSTELIGKYSKVFKEELSIKNMTAAGGAYKKGLNREILSTAPRMFYDMLNYKAEEAGSLQKEIPTKKIKPSQTCSVCGGQYKKLLSDRLHDCPLCGHKNQRDRESARVCLSYGLTGKPYGWEPSICGEVELVKEPRRNRKLVELASVSLASERLESPSIVSTLTWVE